MHKISFLALLFIPLLGAKEAGACSAQNLAHEGDMILVGKGTPVNKMIAGATQTWTSHVGIVLKDGNGLYVFHATPPHVRRDSICGFLASSNNQAILRYKRGLSGSQIERMYRAAKDAADRKLPYDNTHLNESGKTHCSKFVHETYREAGISAGEWKSIRTIANEYTGSEESKQKLIKQWDAKFGGALLGGNAITRTIAWSKQTVTPASQLRDSDFSVVKCTVSDCLGKK